MVEAERLADMVRNFVEENEIANAADVHRMNVPDDVAEFIIGLCEIVGYAEAVEDDPFEEDDLDIMSEYD